jgi:hypothetical protein
MKMALDEFGWRAPHPSVPLQWLTGSLSRDSPYLLVKEFGREYFPFKDCSGLFKIYLDTPPTAEGLLDFVRQYGLLHGHVQEFIAAENDRCPYAVVDGVQCYLQDLIKAHGELTYAARLNEAIKSGSEERAVEICAADWHHPYYESGTYLNWVLELRTLKMMLETTWLEQVRRVFRRYLNDQLARHGCAAAIRPGRNRAWEMVFRPRSLQGVLWFQFASFVTEEKEYAECKECGKPFEIGKGTKQHSGRRDKIFCSTACRVRHHQQRVKGAKAKKSSPAKRKKTKGKRS